MRSSVVACATELRMFEVRVRTTPFMRASVVARTTELRMFEGVGVVGVRPR